MPQPEQVRLVLLCPVERLPLVLPSLLPYPLEPRHFEGAPGDPELPAEPRSVTARLVPDELRDVVEGEALGVVKVVHELPEFGPLPVVQVLDAESPGPEEGEDLS